MTVWQDLHFLINIFHKYCLRHFHSTLKVQVAIDSVIWDKIKTQILNSTNDRPQTKYGFNVLVLWRISLNLYSHVSFYLHVNTNHSNLGHFDINFCIRYDVRMCFITRNILFQYKYISSSVFICGGDEMVCLALWAHYFLNSIESNSHSAFKLRGFAQFHRFKWNI